MKNAKLLMLNTAVLTFGSFLMRTISVSFNIYLTNQIGSSGIGLFQLIIAVYGLTVTFASAGVKLGATRLTTDLLSKNEKNIRCTMDMCIKYSLIAGIFICIVFYMLSGMISKKWIFDTRAEKSIKILAFSLPFVSVSSALNGYFTARKTMVKYSSVQLAEQLAKIVVTVISLKYFGNTGLEYACSAVAFGMTTSEIISALCSYFLYLSDCKKTQATSKSQPSLKSLLRISVPDAVGSGFRSVLLTVEHLLIPQGFKKSGQSVEQSMSIYGVIHGIALPVVLYPSAVISSLSALLIPEFARLKLLSNKDRISFAASKILKLSLIFSIGVGCFIFVFSEAISASVSKSNEANYYIKLLSVLIPVMYTDMITDGLLKGLDRQTDSMKYNILDSAICVVLVYFILPEFAIKGYIFILFLSEIINFALSINKLAQETQIKLNIINDITKPIIFGYICCYFVSFLRKTILYTLPPKILLTVNGILCFILYFGCIYFSDSICKKEITDYTSFLKGKSYA